MQDDRKGVLHFPADFLAGYSFPRTEDSGPEELAQLSTRPARTNGYLSILPWTRESSTPRCVVRPNPLYFDPENIVKLAIEGGCNAVASTFGVLGSVARNTRTRSVHRENQPQRVPFLSNTYDQIMFGDVEMAFEMEPWQSGRRSISAPRNQNVRYRKSLRHSSTRTRWHGDDTLVLHA